jgi:tryptophan synthase alpha chain
MNGQTHLQQMFAQANGRAMFMPYFAVGYPDLATSIHIMEGLANAGADAIEVGVPFSDPLADGPVIQYATQIALQNKVGVKQSIAAIAELRQRGVRIPLMLMSYINPLLAYGGGDLSKLMTDCSVAGVTGFIIPDLPPDEAQTFQSQAEAHGFAYIHFLAPTSDAARMQLVASQARGFIYLVSVTGVTGARNDEVSEELRQFIGRVRQATSQPLVVGFGIGSPQKAQAVGQMADGIIIGSKLIELAKESPQAVIHFAQEVVATMRG